MNNFCRRYLRTLFLKCSDNNHIREYAAIFKIESSLLCLKRDMDACIDMNLRCENEVAISILERFFLQAYEVIKTINCLVEPNPSGEISDDKLLEIEMVQRKVSTARYLETSSACDFRGNLQYVIKMATEYVKDNYWALHSTEFDVFVKNVTRTLNMFICFFLSFIIIVSAAFGLSYKVVILPAIVEYQKHREANKIFDMLDKRIQSGIVADNLSPIEKDFGGKSFRWALGRQLDISFYSQVRVAYELDFEFFSHIANQNVILIINNGEQIKQYTVRDTSKWLETNVANSVEFNTNPGINTISFVFSDYNHFQTTFESADGRPLAAAFTKLKIYPVSAVQCK